MILVRIKDALFFQLADLGGQSASVYLEIVGELLAVEGDSKAVPPRFLRLDGKIGQKLLASGTLGRQDRKSVV